MSAKLNNDNGDTADPEAGSDDVIETKKQLAGLSAQVMNNPEALALMQSKLAGMVGTLSGYYDTLPNVVKRRVKALKKLQVEGLKVEAKFHEEIHALECKYNTLYEPIHKKRQDIVNAAVEPTDEECDFPSDTEDEDDEEKPVKTEEEKKAEAAEKDETTKGIPEFWLTIFKNVEIIAENIQEGDEPILAHLIDVSVKQHEKPMSFTLEFHFSPNEFFTNEVLTKYYEMKCVPDEKDPFSFEGPEIQKCKGCEISWKKGKNVTVRTVTKKQKHKSKGSVRTVTKTVQSDSFFNFFNPPAVPDNEEDIDEETSALLSADFEIGEVIRQRLVGRAVLYFTGEALIDEEYDDEEDEEDDEDEEDEEGSDDDYPDPALKPAKHGKAGRPGKANRENPQECKQQ